MLLSALILLAVVVCGGLFFAQDLLIFPASHEPPKQRVGDIELIEFDVGDALQLPAYLHAPELGEKTVVIFHGNGGTLDLEYGRVKIFSELGLGVLAVEYPGYGGAKGTPSQKSIYGAALAAYDHLVNARGVDGPIVAYGHSLGSAPALYLSANREIASVVLEAPFDSMLAMVKRRFPYAPSFLLRHPFRNDQWIAKTDAPILIMHGTADTVVPFESGQKLALAGGDNIVFTAFDNANHHSILDDGGLLAIAAFLNES